MKPVEKELEKTIGKQIIGAEVIWDNPQTEDSQPQGVIFNFADKSSLKVALWGGWDSFWLDIEHSSKGYNKQSQPTEEFLIRPVQPVFLTPEEKSQIENPEGCPV